MMQNQGIPLVEMAEGADQDDRASLLSAFGRIMGSHRRREMSDLHVRELLTYVLAVDKRGDGVQLSYDDVANILCCERSTARTVVRRAEEVYGLLATYESRYVRGGQAPNRYAIDWQSVRAVNSGNSRLSLRESSGEPADLEAPAKKSRPTSKPDEPAPQEPGDTRMHPPATRAQGGVTRAQPPDTRVHPYKEHTLTLNPPSSLTTTKATDCWQAVVRDLEVLKVTLAKQAVDLARERGLSIEDCTELIAVYRQHHNEHPQPAWLYRWFTGQSRPPDPKPPPDRSHPRGDALSPEEQRKASLRTRIVQAGRARGASEESIAAACRKNGVEY
ncbi:MAG: hypothetical protein Aurels2KO_10580 [Aureliella sp.]